MTTATAVRERPTIGPHCLIDLPSRGPWDDPYVKRIGPRTFDDDGLEQGERINGFDQCPKCGLWWPCIEEPDCWEESDEHPGRFVTTGWFGAAYCDDCGLIVGAGDGVCGLFAPWPSDPNWAVIAEEFPHLLPAVEPGFRLLASRQPLVVDDCRADQLRCAGNGVVPLQAGVAFVELVRRVIAK